MLMMMSYRLLDGDIWYIRKVFSLLCFVLRSSLFTLRTRHYPPLAPILDQRPTQHLLLTRLLQSDLIVPLPLVNLEFLLLDSLDDQDLLSSSEQLSIDLSPPTRNE
jgi:hypothetical protein